MYGKKAVIFLSEQYFFHLAPFDSFPSIYYFFYIVLYVPFLVSEQFDFSFTLILYFFHWTQILFSLF